MLDEAILCKTDRGLFIFRRLKDGIPLVSPMPNSHEEQCETMMRGCAIDAVPMNMNYYSMILVREFRVEYDYR